MLAKIAFLLLFHPFVGEGYLGVTIACSCRAVVGVDAGEEVVSASWTPLGGRTRWAGYDPKTKTFWSN